MENTICKPEALYVVGTAFQQVTKEVSSVSIATRYIHGLKSENLFSQIVKSIEPVKYNPSYLTMLFLFTDEKFKEFTINASREESKDSVWIMDNVLFTTDKEFSQDDLPLCTEVPGNLKPDQIYCIRQVHRKKEDGVRIVDISVYIPRGYLL